MLTLDQVIEATLAWTEERLERELPGLHHQRLHAIREVRLALSKQGKGLPPSSEAVEVAAQTLAKYKFYNWEAMDELRRDEWREMATEVLQAVRGM